MKSDPNPMKTNLGVGAYRDDNGQPYILECVRIAERRLLDSNVDHEYEGILGEESFRREATKLAFGNQSSVIKDQRYACVQALSGMGSIRLAFDFMKDWYPNKKAKILIPDVNWPFHRQIAGVSHMEIGTYRYYNSQTKSIDIEGMLEDLDKADPEQIVILHTCAHNPTGCDPTQDDWRQIVEVLKRKNHFCGFDSAYQGFASGNLDTDAFSMRLMAEHTDRICLFQSFSKNFGLYGERTGCLTFVTSG